MTNVRDDELPWTPEDPASSDAPLPSELAADQDDDASASAPRAMLRAQIRLGVAALVTVVGLWLARGLLPDALYYLQDEEEPDRVESLAQVVASEDGIDQLRNRYVDLSATPDVRTAAKLSKKEGQESEVAFVRLVEGGMSVFVTMPKPVLTSGQTLEYPGRFTGRVRPLADLGIYKWVQAYFEGQDLRERLELAPSIWKGLQAAVGQPIKLSDEQSVQIGQDDHFEVTVKLPEYSVQLGRRTWRTKEAAQAALSALNLPFAPLDLDNPSYFSFAVRPTSQSTVELEKALNQAAQAPADSPHLEEGARAFAMTRSFVVHPAHFKGLDSGDLQLLPVSTVLPPGFELKEGKTLAAFAWPVEGHVFAANHVTEVVLARRLKVDSQALVIVAGEVPSGHLMNAILFLVVAGMIVGNLIAAARALIWLRKTAAGLEPQAS